MKKLFLLLFLFVSCEVPQYKVIKFEQLPIPVELLNIKEAQMIILINEHRTNMGLPAYKTSLSLYYIAKENCVRMAGENNCNHNWFESRYIESKALLLGEGVSYNYKSAQSNVQAYINSTAHRDLVESSLYEYFAVADVDDWNCILMAKY